MALSQSYVDAVVVGDREERASVNRKNGALERRQNLDPMAGKSFFADPAMDRLVGVTLSLSEELWVALERIAALEAFVHPSTANMSRNVGRERDAFIRSIFAAIREPLDPATPE